MTQPPSDSNKYVCLRRTNKDYFGSACTYCQLLLSGVIRFT